MLSRMRLIFLVIGLTTIASLAADKPTKERELAPAGAWAYTTPQRPAVPMVRQTEGIANPIDCFIQAKLEAQGLTMSPPADKLTLLRRISFDLIGLPPTLSDQEAFLKDESPDAYRKVVERLLDSPHYGERWAQHWLDLARYAETDGFKADDYRPSAHLYRDYVIQAFNNDLPYDRFVQQQLAGDELEPDNPQALVAAGFNRLWPDEYNAANLEQRRQEILDDMTEVTGSAFLGLTVGCARCHNHKFDPILQTDYFRLQAHFAPMQTDETAYLADGDQLRKFKQELAAWEEKTRPIREAMHSLVAAKEADGRARALEKFRTEIQEAVRTPEAKRTPYQHAIALIAEPQLVRGAKDVAKKLNGEAKAKYEAIQAQLDAIPKPKAPPQIMGVRDMGRERIPPTHLLAGGDWRKPKAPLEPGFPEFLRVSVADVTPTPLPNSTGQRAALARWLTQREHPLTARVMVNRLWQHHFGVGIVATPNDFGAQGDPPTHPELLDWLAVEFMDHGWSLKHVHRLMVLSATYRQSSIVDATRPETARALEVDKENKLLWRANRQRQEGEALRDAMLYLAGELNLRMFGPSARPKLPEKLSSAAWKPDAQPENQKRRSIYIFAKRNVRYPMFDAFDLPDMHNSCARRTKTVTAPQALLMLNGDVTMESAHALATKSLGASRTGQPRSLNKLLQEILGHEPSLAELQASGQFLSRQQVRWTQALQEGQVKELTGTEPAEDFFHALFNSNAFVYVD